MRIRLLNVLTHQLVEFIDKEIPSFAILSHMWDPEEVSLLQSSILDLQDSSVLEKDSFKKIKNCCHQAQLDGIQWVWIDTCCLDRSNKEELYDTINSAYRVLEESAFCYAFLSDVSSTEIPSTLENSVYFKRRWTLQELVAPDSVKFFAKDWVFIGTRSILHHIISKATGIQSAVLTGEKKPKQCHVSERMSWASNRVLTTRVEDEAYSIMGLFDITMPILYGEGSRAFRRLQDKIRKTHYPSILDTARTGMRLLATKSEPLQIQSFFGSDSPEYAILSHTWGSPEDEVSFSDVCQGKAKDKKLYEKVQKSCDLAASHGFDYIWIDTCCIDKSSSAELQEAICSMYRWYKNARICYVYLEDIVAPAVPVEKVNFWNSRWFTRGWTLQELIAPTFLEFYDKQWNEIGTKLSLCGHISEVTGIDRAVLRGSDPTKHSIAERMSWAASRSTTRVEDTAYCLLGLFDVFIPMLYGEGSRAFIRLQEELMMKHSEDYTIFAWKASFISDKHRGLLAHSPDEFLGSKMFTSGGYDEVYEPENPPTLTSRGLLLEVPLLEQANNRYLAWVGSAQNETKLCIWLQSLPSKRQSFVRVDPGSLELLPSKDGQSFSKRRIYVLPSGTMNDEETFEGDNTRSGLIVVNFPQSWEIRLLSQSDKVVWTRGSRELLYSYERESCLLATHVLRKGDDSFFVMIGFHNHLPWCSVACMKKLGYSSYELPAIAQNLFNNIEWLSKQTDRSSASLPNGSAVTAAFRVSVPTTTNPNVFNLLFRWTHLHPEHRLVSSPRSYTESLFQALSINRP